jgi:hypothetical protein
LVGVRCGPGLKQPQQAAAFAWKNPVQKFVQSSNDWTNFVKKKIGYGDRVVSYFLDRFVLLSRFLIEVVSEPRITLEGKASRGLKAERTR